MLRVARLLPILAMAACATEPPPAEIADKSLRAGIVARVGSIQIEGATVQAIAQAQGVSLREARQRAVFDALFASEAEAALSDAQRRSSTQSVLARAMLRELWLAAEAVPISDEELERMTEVNWTKYDRPKSYRSVHAVVEVDSKASADEHAKARALAEKIRQAVIPVAARAQEEPAPDFDEDAALRITKCWADPLRKPFVVAAEAVEAGGLKVTVQLLPAVAAGGRVVDHGGGQVKTFLEEFSRPVAALGERGRLSDVVKSSAGYHVILLLGTIAEKRSSRAERLVGLRPQIMEKRARKLRLSVLKGLAGQAGVQLESNHDAVLRQLKLDGTLKQ